jgi:hypothetical protein
MNEVTQTFISAAKKALSQSRPGDWQHAERVVNWVRELSTSNLPERELIIKAAYIHDIGWKGIFPKTKTTITKQELLENEPQANRNSNPFVTEFLLKLGHTKKDILTILKYIAAADRHESKDENDAIIVDADNLSKLNINHVREKYDKKDWLEIFELLSSELPVRFKLPKAKEVYNELLKQLKQDIDKELIN